jgi:hypothetical protein
MKCFHLTYNQRCQIKFVNVYVDKYEMFMNLTKSS